MPARSALIAALLAIVAAVAGCGAAQKSFVPTENDQDPARRIVGIKVYADTDTTHVTAAEQVPYKQVPPTGGPHDLAWAECTGTVYDTAVRNENMVHSLEHGAVWIAYHPEQVTGPQLQTLVSRVRGQPYTILSPYPDLPAPISLQAWGHQLRVDDAQDPRIGQFIQALRANPYTSPEPGSPCEAPALFDPADPPAFDS